MKLLFATSECAPYSKSGGLADVAFSLPPALKKAGNEVEIITPYYKCVKDRFADEVEYVGNTYIRLGDANMYCGLFRGVLSDVPVWFVDNEELFYRDRLYGYSDDKFRFAWFSKVVIEVLPQLDFIPDILHCNDWETALSVIYLKDDQARRSDYRNIRTVFTIHNIAYQGQFGVEDLTTTFALDPGWYEGALGYEYENRHDVNLMKGAMLMADAVSTVSPGVTTTLPLNEFLPFLSFFKTNCPSLSAWTVKEAPSLLPKSRNSTFIGNEEPYRVRSYSLWPVLNRPPAIL